jgi:predicted Zn-dependent protease
MNQGTAFGPDDHYHHGLALLRAGRGDEAFEHLSRAYLASPQKACFRSAYALALALVRGQFLGAVELARGAVREEFYNPELYLNLARIYSAFGLKAEAIRYLRRGLMVDPESSTLQGMLLEFGIRRRPPVRFLPREHLINRLLGKLQARFLAARERPSEVAPQVA